MNTSVGPTRFRVFYDDKMWYSDDFDNPCYQFMVSMDGTVRAWNKMAYDLYHYTTIDDAIVMLWTGLKDREGTDIYDGDILEFDADEWGSPSDNRWPVTWDYHAACWDTGGGTNSECSEWKTVVGNIYEDKT